jgi:hypothetical protein
MGKQDRAPQQPIAASFGAAVLYRGFKHWFVSYAFLPSYRTRPAGGGPRLDRQGLLPPSTAPPASGCPSASPDRYGGREQGLSPRPVIWRLVAQFPNGRRMTDESQGFGDIFWVGSGDRLVGEGSRRASDRVV